MKIPSNRVHCATMATRCAFVLSMSRDVLLLWGFECCLVTARASPNTSLAAGWPLVTELDVGFPSEICQFGLCYL